MSVTIEILASHVQQRIRPPSPCDMQFQAPKGSLLSLFFTDLFFPFSVIPLAEGFTCEDGHVRLADGAVNTEGRVEICFDQRYGTICDDLWDNTDASVVCRQLGYSTESKYGVRALQGM